MTQINKELLEKYELGQCTDQERKIVLEWLDNDSWDQLDSEASTSEIQQEKGEILWSNLQGAIQTEQKPKRLHLVKYSVAIAASLLFVVTTYFLVANCSTIGEYDKVEYSSLEKIKNPFTLILSKNSQAQINIKTGNFTLTGEILFTPNQDLVLQHGQQDNLYFKAGETYYLAERKDSDRILVIKKGDFTFLPAIVQKQIRKQFQIS